MQIAARADRVSTTATRVHTSTSPRTARQPSPSRSTVTRLAGSRRRPTTGPPPHRPPWKFSTRPRACPSCACPMSRAPTTTTISPAPCLPRSNSRPRVSSPGLPPTRPTAHQEQRCRLAVQLRPRLHPPGHGRSIRHIIQGYPGRRRGLLPTWRSLHHSSPPHHSKRNIPPPRTHLPIPANPPNTIHLGIVYHSPPIARPIARRIITRSAAIVIRLRLRQRTRLRWWDTSVCSFNTSSI